MPSSGASSATFLTPLYSSYRLSLSKTSQELKALTFIKQVAAEVAYFRFQQVLLSTERSELRWVPSCVFHHLIVKVVLADLVLQHGPSSFIPHFGLSKSIHRHCQSFGVQVVLLLQQEGQQLLFNQTLRLGGLGHSVAGKYVESIGSKGDWHVVILLLDVEKPVQTLHSFLQVPPDVGQSCIVVVRC